jgi:hypothetical protein
LSIDHRISKCIGGNDKSIQREMRAEYENLLISINGCNGRALSNIFFIPTSPTDPS